MGSKRRGAGPEPGSPEHWPWVAERIREYAQREGIDVRQARRDPFLADQARRYGTHAVTRNDVGVWSETVGKAYGIKYAGYWDQQEDFAAAMDSALGEVSPPTGTYKVTWEPSATGTYVHAPSASIDVDISDLDFDDDGTEPFAERIVKQPDPQTSKPIVEARHLLNDKAPETTRQPEPRELLEAQKARAEAVQLKRQLRDTLEALRQADERAGILDTLRSAPTAPPIISRRERASGMREATPVVMCSDWHVEEIVAPGAIENRNAYSPDVARNRVKRLTDGTLWLLDSHRPRFAMRDMILWLGGDLISGRIHEELSETNAMSPPEATLFAQELCEGMLRSLLEQTDLERIIVACSHGNHGRIGAKRRHKEGAQTSFEWMMYHQLARVFADEPRLDFRISNGAHLYVDVYDWTLRFHHGDDINYWGGVGGLTIPVRKALANWASFKHADLTCCGHFHSYHDFRDFVINGSLIGYSEYALAVKAQYEPAQQAFFLVDSKRFKCMSTPIWVAEEA